jgi:hypothetical protein
VSPVLGCVTTQTARMQVAQGTVLGLGDSYPLCAGETGTGKQRSPPESRPQQMEGGGRVQRVQPEPHREKEHCPESALVPGHHRDIGNKVLV